MTPRNGIAVSGLHVGRRTLAAEVVNRRLSDGAADGPSISDVVTSLFDVGRNLHPHRHGDLDLIRSGAFPVGAAIQRFVELLDDFSQLPVVDRNADRLTHTRGVAASALTVGGRR